MTGSLVNEKEQKEMLALLYKKQENRQHVVSDDYYKLQKIKSQNK